MNATNHSIPDDGTTSPVISPALEMTRKEVREALDQIVYGYLPTACAGISVLYLVLALLHALFLSKDIFVIMMPVSLVSALTSLFLFLLLRKKTLNPVWGNRILAGLAFLSIVNLDLHLILTRESFQATNFILIFLLSGFFILSARWLLFVIGAIWAGWVVVNTHFSIANWQHFNILMIQGTILAGVAHLAQVRTHKRNAAAVKQLADAKHHLDKRTRQLEETTGNLEQQVLERIHINDLLRQFVKNAPAPIAMVDRNMKYLLYSKQWVRDFHLGDRDLTGLNHYDVFKNLPDHWKEVYWRCLNGATEQCDEDYFWREGGILEWIRWEIHPWYEHGGKVGGIIMFIEMISARKNAEAELRRSEERFRQFFNLSLIGNGIVDREGRFIEVNDYACQLSGYARDELLTKKAHEITHPDDIEISRDYFQKALTGEIEGYSISKRYIRKDGTIIYVLASLRSIRRSEGLPQLFVGNMIDISDRVLAENALRDSEERLQDFLDSAHDLIQCVSPEGRFLYVNRAWKKTLGYDDGDVSRLSLFDIIHPESIPNCMINFQQVLGGQSLANYETVFVAKDGRQIAVQGNVNCRFENGKPTIIQAIFRDVTQYRRAELELKLAKERAEEANRAKSQFLANMSHELRTPLNSVIGFANILQKNKYGVFDGRDLNFIAKIVSNGRHLLDLINDILDLSKIEAGKMEIQLSTVSLDKLIRETLSQLESQTRGKPLRLEVIIPGALRSIDADAGKLHQILVNLIGNALKFTEKGIVRVSVIDDDGRPTRIDVMDTGIGIHPDRQERIFEAFHQADSSTARKYGGTGLGLAICKSFCQILGYRISLQSQEGKGSTFSIHLSK